MDLGVINLGREGGKTCSRLFDGTVDGLLLPRGFFLRYVRVRLSRRLSRRLIVSREIRDLDY